MNFSKLILISISVLLFSLTGCNKTETTGTSQTTFQYKTQDELKQAIEKKEDIVILDIQPEADFNQHHIKGAMATYAFPVKSDEEKAKLDQKLPTLMSNNKPIYIVCPRGGGGAKNTFNYLKEKGVPTSRMFILENGQQGWTHEELLEKQSS